VREIRQIPIIAITVDPGQPRKDFNQDAILELSQSIRRNGLLQPITVRETERGYIIIAGERRFRAVTLLGWETIDCIVYNGSSAKELQLIENINRADLNPMEVAEAYQSYLDNNHTLDELSEVIGKPKNIISWYLNITRCVPEIKHLVKHNQISLVVAIAQSKLSENGQRKTLNAMQRNKLSVSECRNLCERVYAEENQIELLPDVPKLSDKEIETRIKVQNALERACQAFVEVNKIEADNPGITAQAIVEKLDITQERVDLLYKLVGQFKNSLQNRRVAALC
jgi:ParB family chromosome partitioning protein